MAKRNETIGDEPRGEKLKLSTKAKKNIAGLKHKTRAHVSRLWATKRGRAILIIGSIILLLAILFAIPFTRFLALSPIIKKDVTITVVDSKTGQPVSDVTVALGKSSAQTDKNGIAKLKSVPVGQPNLKITKQYYESYSADYTVPVIFSPAAPTIKLRAQGRPITVTITNKITGEPVADVNISSSKTSATTNAEGKATIILPPNQESWPAILSGNSYNSLDVKLLDDLGTKNTFTLTPSGTIYYLSKATGTINVMKSDLDGGNATVAVAGTGQEGDNDTSLLSSRDWRYSALLATRTDNKSRVYLIDSNKSGLSVIDEGDASFSLIGWSGHNFVYLVNRNTTNYWDDKRQAIKSYNADSGKLITIYETTGIGVAYYNNSYQSIIGSYILGDQVVFLSLWNGTPYNPPAAATSDLISATIASGDQKVIKAFSAKGSPFIKLYEPQALYVRYQPGTGGDANFYKYENGSIQSLDAISDDKFYGFYPTYLISPSGKKTFWYEPRDGKNTLFIGDSSGDNAKTVGSLSEYTPYGWYGANDEYILLSKNGSELYIASADKVIGENDYQPIKITDYHRAVIYNGYGSGYGGQ